MCLQANVVSGGHVELLFEAVQRTFAGEHAHDARVVLVSARDERSDESAHGFGVEVLSAVLRLQYGICAVIGVLHDRVFVIEAQEKFGELRLSAGRIGYSADVDAQRAPVFAERGRNGPCAVRSAEEKFDAPPVDSLVHEAGLADNAFEVRVIARSCCHAPSLAWCLARRLAISRTEPERDR